jgi:hypothetical protein
MIEFREDTHEYFKDGKKLISVTQLMRKHGLAPSYDSVPDAVLKAKAERGTLIHKEIEDYLKNGEVGFTVELDEFRKLIASNGNIKPIASEEIVHNDIVAGTVDLVTEDYGELTINDFKTTATLHKEPLSWQLSIYAYLWGLVFNDRPSKGKAYHFNAEGKLNVVDIPLKPMAEVERLLECERNGERYTLELTGTDAQLAELAEVESLIKAIEEQKKAAEAQAVELRAAIMAAMEANGVTSFENERIKLTYVAPTTRTAIDSAKLKKDLPEIAERYTKTSNVKASLRITLKE